MQAEGASTSAEHPPTAATEPAASHFGGMLAKEIRAHNSEVLLFFSCFRYMSSGLHDFTVQIQAMMDMIHTPPATGPTQSQLDNALGRVEELQERLSQLERERESRIKELEAHVAAAKFEANSTRRVTPFLLEHIDYC